MTTRHRLKYTCRIIVTTTSPWFRLVNRNTGKCVNVVGALLEQRACGTGAKNYIGKSQFSADPYLNGAVDEFRIYNRALSAAEVSTLYTTP